MKITIDEGDFCKAVVTCTDGVKIVCMDDKEVLEQVKNFLYEITPKDKFGKVKR